MRHNLRRTAITILGMAWGIATVVLLLAYGAGFGRAFETIFAQFGTNVIGSLPRHAPASRPAVQRPASKCASAWTMSNASRNAFPVVIHVAPVVCEARARAERSPHLHMGGRRHVSRSCRKHPEL